eukprot:TRINITY_DN9470_c0_g2_i2.p1 TRINITY_DN9470_c0_g2~~TRINITY_DN9470_c0_g2_i2.p1  ORF type:complete len:185 (+),score=27.55 TRINITY_DN9470_c0_g2_i2:46-555(+)
MADSAKKPKLERNDGGKAILIAQIVHQQRRNDGLSQHLAQLKQGLSRDPTLRLNQKRSQRLIKSLTKKEQYETAIVGEIRRLRDALQASISLNEVSLDPVLASTVNKLIDTIKRTKQEMSGLQHKLKANQIDATGRQLIARARQLRKENAGMLLDMNRASMSAGHCMEI